MSRRSADDSYHPAPRAHPLHREGTLTRIIEQQTAEIPSAFFLVAASAAMAASVILELNGRPRVSQFIAMWTPTLLIAGVYNKLVKTLGTP